MAICCGGFWELNWWEIVIFFIVFCLDMYLIIKAPSTPDLTKKHTSYESTSSEESSDKPAI